MFSDPNLILSVKENQTQFFLSTALSDVLINIKKFEKITRRSEQSVKGLFYQHCKDFLYSTTTGSLLGLYIYFVLIKAPTVL